MFFVYHIRSDSTTKCNSKFIFVDHPSLLHRSGDSDLYSKFEIYVLPNIRSTWSYLKLASSYLIFGKVIVYLQLQNKAEVEGHNLRSHWDISCKALLNLLSWYPFSAYRDSWKGSIIFLSLFFRLLEAIFTMLSYEAYHPSCIICCAGLENFKIIDLMRITTTILYLLWVWGQFNFLPQFYRQYKLLLKKSPSFTN